MGLSSARPDQQPLSEQQQPPPPPQQPLPAQPPPSFVNQLPPMSSQPTSFDHLVPAPAVTGNPLSPGDSDKLAPQFKVKPASALMPDDKKAGLRDKPGFKKKSRSNKSPVGSPHPPVSEPPMFGMEATTGTNALNRFCKPSF